MRSAIDESELVTKKDLQIALAPISADLNLIKWMMGALIAVAVHVQHLMPSTSTKVVYVSGIEEVVSTRLLLK